VQDAWSQQPGNKKYLEEKKEANDVVRALADLPNEEKRGIQVLEQKKKESQLNRFLDRFLIAHAKIKKIGSGRKTVLASFGIETAADIDARKISGIQGFGPSLVAELVAWRQTQASKFLFNPNEPTNQADLAALKSKIAARKADLENKIRTSTINDPANAPRSRRRGDRVDAIDFPVNRSGELARNIESLSGPVPQLACLGRAALGRLMGWLPAGARGRSRAAPSTTPGVAAGVTPKPVRPRAGKRPRKIFADF
jgi:hypothetical protein